jgi:hypothetical protein
MNFKIVGIDRMRELERFEHDAVKDIAWFQRLKKFFNAHCDGKKMHEVYGLRYGSWWGRNGFTVVDLSREDQKKEKSL